MSVTYNIGSLNAQLKVVAIHARHGGIIREDLNWELIREDSKDKRHLDQKHFISDEATPLFEIPDGSYLLKITHQERTKEIKNLKLQKNTLTELVILFQEMGKYDDDQEYFVDPTEYEAITEHERRAADREGQREFGDISGLLTDPYNKKEQGHGQLIQGHPLLQSVQFDGIDPKVQQTTENNTEGLAKTLEMQKQLSAQPAMNPSAGPRPGG